MQVVYSLLVATLTVAPKLVLADGIVPCGDTDQPACQTCHFYSLVDNAFTWIFGVAATIAAIIIVFAGMRLVLAQGNAEVKKVARKYIFTALFGFILIMAAWVLVEILIAVLQGNDDPGSIFSIITCVNQP
jgi:hypothetical protein